MHKKYSLGVVSQEPFPIGIQANRILSYASEWVKSKNVKIYIPLSTEFGSKINNKEPFKAKVSIINMQTIQLSGQKNLIKFKNLPVIISTIKLLFNIKKDNPSALIFYANSGVISFFQIFFNKIILF